MAKKVLTIRLDANKINELKAYADASGLSLAGVVQSLVEDRLAGRNVVIYKCPVSRKEVLQTLAALREMIGVGEGVVSSGLDSKLDRRDLMELTTKLRSAADIFSGVLGLGKSEEDIANITEAIEWTKKMYSTYTRAYTKSGDLKEKSIADRSEKLLNFCRRFVSGL